MEPKLNQWLLVSDSDTVPDMRIIWTLAGNVIDFV
jgi:hypothetical protein